MIGLKEEQGIVTLSLERADKRNALSPELVDALNGALEEVAGRETMRVLILAGEGPCFCAGLDLQGILDNPPATTHLLQGLSIAMRRIRRLPVPTIARVQGAAIGGGCGLMVVSDFAFTHPEAKVGYPEVDLGVCPAVVSPWLMRKIGPSRTRAMLLAGGTMSGEQGFAAGLATHLVDAEHLTEATINFARQLACGDRHALMVTKAWLNRLDHSIDDTMLDRAADLSAEVIMGDEAQARLRKIRG